MILTADCDFVYNGNHFFFVSFYSRKQICNINNCRYSGSDLTVITTHVAIYKKKKKKCTKRIPFNNNRNDVVNSSSVKMYDRIKCRFIYRFYILWLFRLTSVFVGMIRMNVIHIHTWKSYVRHFTLYAWTNKNQHKFNSFSIDRKVMTRNNKELNRILLHDRHKKRTSKRKIYSTSMYASPAACQPFIFTYVRMVFYLLCIYT